MMVHDKNKVNVCNVAMNRINMRNRPGEFLTRSYIDNLYDVYQKFINSNNRVILFDNFKQPIEPFH